MESLGWEAAYVSGRVEQLMKLDADGVFLNIHPTCTTLAFRRHVRQLRNLACTNEFVTKPHPLFRYVEPALSQLLVVLATFHRFYHIRTS